MGKRTVVEFGNRKREGGLGCYKFEEKFARMMSSGLRDVLVGVKRGVEGQ